MSTSLCFDFGNTRKKCAVFAGREFIKEIVLENDDAQTIEHIIKEQHPDKSILSSVINHNPEVENILSKKTKFHKLSHLSKLPISTPVGKPESIGADRLALVVAAVDLFPQKNNLVIGLGSAITYNYINKYHAFMGGGIAPGMEMRFKSLHEYTAFLPLVKADWNFPLAG